MPWKTNSSRVKERKALWERAVMLLEMVLGWQV